MREHSATASHGEGGKTLLDYEYLKTNILDEGILFLLREMLDTYRTSAREMLAQLYEATARGDLKTVEFLAHRLKGASGAVGGAGMVALTAAVEQAAVEGRSGDVQVLAADIEPILAATLSELEALL